MKKYIVAVVAVAVLFSCKPQDEKQDSPQKENAKEETKAVGNILQVGVKELVPEMFRHFFEISGEVEAINSAFISPEMNGQIKQIYVKEGQRVKKGDLLVRINDNVLRNSLQEVQTGLELAIVVYKKQEELWSKKIGSEIQYLEAKTNKESLENKLRTINAQIEMAKIRAPFDGIVDAVLKKEGELAVPGYEIIRLVNLDKIKVNADIAETYVSVVKLGDSVRVNFPSIPNYEVATKISRIGNIVNPANRAIRLEVNLQNNNGLIKPNALAVLRINDYVNKKAFVVPSIVIKKDVSNNNFLFVVEQDGSIAKAKKIIVQTGKSYEGKTEIISGVATGDKVIVDGYNLVSNGAEVKIN